MRKSPLYGRALAVLLRRLPRELAAAALAGVGEVLYRVSPRRRSELARREGERSANGGSWLTPGERAIVEALAGLIVPSEGDSPGTADLGVLGPSAVPTLDLWIGASREKQVLYARGLLALDDLARRRFGSRFAELTSERQEELFKIVEALHRRRFAARSLVGKVQHKLERLSHLLAGSAPALDLFPAVGAGP